MENQRKYRNPKISEFVDGFKYEEYSNYNNRPRWTEVKFGTPGNNWSKETLIYRIKRGDFRVKIN